MRSNSQSLSRSQARPEVDISATIIEHLLDDFQNDASAFLQPLELLRVNGLYRLAHDVSGPIDVLGGVCGGNKTRLEL